ncbi:MAG: HAMP domain-containing sensor histidine kinase, partial [Planctomycetota bacterium]|nr:HAMP domain-containing sensor histidine kinase [Planctomycetota bacterium]
FGAAHVERVMRTGRPVVEQGYWPSDARHSDPDSVRTVAVPLTGTDGRPYAAVLTVTDRFTSAQQGLLRGVVVIALIIAPIASAVSGWYIAGIAVLPLEKLRQLASRLAPDSSDTIMTDNSLGATTEVIRLASEWDAARARVAERFAAQDRFLSNVSHEIKTPIAVMLTEAQTIDRSRLGPEAREFVDSVVEEMSRLGRLVESFLTLARIQDGKGLARFRPYAVNDLVMDSVDNCRRMADQHRIRLEPGLFTDDESFDLAVSGEPELLRTMLDNLIRNAVRFSPENGVVCVAPARDRDNPRLIAIAVEDEGAGIPAERLHTIFDRFAQAPNQPRQGRGHGLGLTIALGIAELHAGTITAENRRGGGCRFTVVLPIADAAEQTAAPRDTRQTRAAGIS